MLNLIGGSWVVVNGVLSRAAVVMTSFGGLLAILITTHEPPSRSAKAQKSLQCSRASKSKPCAASCHRTPVPSALTTFGPNLGAESVCLAKFSWLLWRLNFITVVMITLLLILMSSLL